VHKDEMIAKQSAKIEELQNEIVALLRDKGHGPSGRR
jgi:hypothetical protein